VLNRSEDWALLLGRLFVAALFLPSGFNKLMTFSAFAASLASKGVPYAEAVAAVLTAAEFLGPIALVIGLWPRWTALALIGFTGATLWLTHRNAGIGVVFRPRQNLQFYQTLAIIGGLLFYFASGPGGLSRTSLRRG
jgi:putative oxidoreductase